MSAGDALPLHDDASSLREVERLRTTVAELRAQLDEARSREARQSAVIENALDCIITIDHRGRVVEFNAAAEATFGASRDKVIGRELAEVIIPPEMRAAHRAGLARFLETGEARVIGKRLEVPALRADGTTFPSELAITLLRTDGPPLFTAHLRDISERKALEASVRGSEARFRALMEQAPFSVQILAPDGRTIGVNRAWEELWGASLADMEGYNIRQDPQLDARGVLGPLERAFAGEASFIPPVRYDPRETLALETLHDDSVRWVGAVAYPLKDERGDVREVVLVHEDITARKRAEAAIHESEEKLRLLADTIPQLAWMANPDGEIFWYNRRWYEYTGTTAEEMRGWGWQSVHAPDRLDAVLERWRQSLATGEPFDMVFPIRGADGEFHPFLTRVNPLRDEHGRILYWFGTNTDISEIKRMEMALVDADRRKDEFLATLAHELRNPLAPIRNGLHLIQLAGGDPTAVDQARALIDRQLQQLVRLVDDLMDMSRITTGKVQFRMDVVPLADVIRSAIETSRPLIDQMGHQLTVEIPDGPLLVEVDPTRMAQALLNVLNNAAKYSEPGSRILLSVQARGSEALVSVRDSGIGIEADHLPHVFDMFSQVDRSLERSQGGLGIGLSLAKRLVELHGGTIEAHSAGPGKGSEFVVRLPLHTGTVVPVSRPGTADAADQSTFRCLVVDDNRDGADSLAMILTSLGNQASTAYDGEEAIASVASFRPDVVVLDIGLPKLNGYDVCRRVRAMEGGKHILIIAQTGWGQDLDRQRTASAGFDHHLVKPVDPTALMALVRSLSRLRAR